MKREKQQNNTFGLNFLKNEVATPDPMSALEYMYVRRVVLSVFISFFILKTFWRVFPDCRRMVVKLYEWFVKRVLQFRVVLVYEHSRHREVGRCTQW